MNESYTIYPGVDLGSEASLGEFVLLGLPWGEQQPGSLITRVGSRAVIRSHTVIYAGNEIGDDFQTGHGVLIRHGNRIGDGVSVGSHSVIEYSVIIHDRVRIHSRVFVPEFSELGDGCFLGPGVVLTNARYPLSDGVKDDLVGPTIGARAVLGANSTVLPGISVGEDAITGAGAVIVEDVPPGAVVVGNPARIIRQRADIPAYASAMRDGEAR